MHKTIIGQKAPRSTNGNSNFVPFSSPGHHLIHDEIISGIGKRICAMLRWSCGDPEFKVRFSKDKSDGKLVFSVNGGFSDKYLRTSSKGIEETGERLQRSSPMWGFDRFEFTASSASGTLLLTDRTSGAKITLSTKTQGKVLLRP